MHWNSAAEFFAMGGYGLYVWGSFGTTAICLVLEIWLLNRQRKNTLRSLRNELQSERRSA